jgi:hypothetical protein
VQLYEYLSNSYSFSGAILAVAVVGVVHAYTAGLRFWLYPFLYYICDARRIGVCLPIMFLCLLYFLFVGTVLLVRYAKKKLLEYQEKEAAECLAQIR